MALLLPSPSRLGINTGGNTEGGQQGEITFLHSSSHAGPLLARFAGGLRILGWAHFAVAVVVLVIDALHGDWLKIVIVLALRINNFRYLVRYVRVDEVRTGVGAQSACMLAHEHGSRVCTHRW